MKLFLLHPVMSPRGGWDNANAGAMPKIAIVQKPCYVEATCQLPYETLVEATNACLPQNKSKSFLSVSYAGENVSVACFQYLLMYEKLNFSLSMWLFLMLCRV